MIAEIIFPVPLHRSFHYRLKPEWFSVARPGLRVRASFGPRMLVGMIIAVHNDEAVDLSGFKTLKTIDSLLETEPVLKDDVPALSAFMSDKWNAPQGLAAENFFGAFWKDFLPNLPQVPADGRIFTENYQPVLSGTGLTGLIDEIASSNNSTRVQVLFGPAQNGRYEVYTELAVRAVKAGGQVLFLVPDLNLVSPLEASLRKIFVPTVMALWHSRLTPKQKREAWYGIRAGSVKVAIGARSAVFLPFQNLKLAVMDEEQDDIYKQEEQTPNFHTRDLMLKRAKAYGAGIILAGAAPCAETYYKARTGEYIWRQLPLYDENKVKITVIDMTKRWEIISGALEAKLKSVVASGNQALVLAGRKGFASLLICANCGWLPRCQKCKVPQGVTKNAEAGTTNLICGRCGKKTDFPAVCPVCSGKVLREAGNGTQRVEAYLKKLLPNARVARSDGDVVRKSVKDAGEIHAQFAAGKFDILVGTRLLARGHDFPGLGLIGVIDSDSALGSADFRASEKIFQSLYEAASALLQTRAAQPELIVQTRQAGHHIFKVLPEQNYVKFADEELEARKDFSYPPFARLIRLTAISADHKVLLGFIQEVMTVLDAFTDSPAGANTEILGPMVLGTAKKSKLLRESYLLKLPDDPALALCLGILRKLKPPKPVKLEIIADPYGL